MAFQPPTNSQMRSAMVVLIILATLMICMAVFLTPDNIDHVRVNGELIKKTDPRFPHAVMVGRLVAGFIGLFFVAFGSIYLWRSPKPPTDE
jgi:hypothetical protein